jgi:hypothetical protein
MRNRKAMMAATATVKTSTNAHAMPVTDGRTKNCDSILLPSLIRRTRARLPATVASCVKFGVAMQFEPPYGTLLQPRQYTERKHPGENLSIRLLYGYFCFHSEVTVVFQRQRFPQVKTGPLAFCIELKRKLQTATFYFSVLSLPLRISP